jgi:hypothetical protein
MPSASFSGLMHSNEKLLHKRNRHVKYGSSSDASFVKKSSLNFSINDTILFICATSFGEKWQRITT